MIQNQWKQLLPAWPAVPPRLWLTAAGVGGTGLCLVFRKEIWPHRWQAEAWSWATLLLLLFFGGIQVIWLLKSWPDAYAGPRWMRLILRGIALVVGFGIGMIMLLLLFIGCLLVP